MMAMKEVPPEMLYRRCKPDDLKFETKAELKTGVEIPGVRRERRKPCDLALVSSVKVTTSPFAPIPT
jgi:hypothetical protein